jgi:hypothetical protein
VRINGYFCVGLKELGETAYKEYGPVFRVWITVMPGVFLLAPEHIQVTLSEWQLTVPRLHARQFVLLTNNTEAFP